MLLGKHDQFVAAASAGDGTLTAQGQVPGRASCWAWSRVGGILRGWSAWGSGEAVRQAGVEAQADQLGIDPGLGLAWGALLPDQRSRTTARYTSWSGSRREVGLPRGLNSARLVRFINAAGKSARRTCSRCASESSRAGRVRRSPFAVRISPRMRSRMDSGPATSPPSRLA